MPHFSIAHSNLGNVLNQQGNFQEAEASCRRALQLEAGFSGALNNLGNALVGQGRLGEAIASYREAIRLQPNFPDAHYNLGNALHRQGGFREAETCFREALRLQPNSPDSHFNLADTLRRQDRIDEAIASYGQAISLRPDHAQAHTNLGVALMAARRLDEAAACLRRAIELCPDQADAYSNLGTIYATQGLAEQAITSYRRALELRPDSADVYSNLGLALIYQGKHDEAEVCVRQALAIDPAHPAALNNLGVVFYQQGRVGEVIKIHELSLARQPDFAVAHANRGRAWLALGNMEEGWAELEWRFREPQYALCPFRQPSWDGSPLAGRTILLHAEQGLGDTIQFIRYAPMVKQRCGRVIVECQRPLLRLLQRCRGVDQLVAEGSALPLCDAQASLMSLPAIFRTNPSTIPADVPYLAVEEELIDCWEKKLKLIAGIRIGIAWQGSPQYLYDRLRSIPLLEFAPLAELSGVRLTSLQKGPGTEQLRGAKDLFSIVDWSDELDDFMDTAAIMKSLDLVVTVDSAIAHLAGAGRDRLGGLALRSGLALAAGARRLPLVSNHAIVPSTTAWRLATGISAHGS